MSIEFDTDQQARQFTSRQFPGQSRESGIAGWLIRRGIVKDDAGAKPILIAIVVINFAIAASVIYFFVF